MRRTTVYWLFQLGGWTFFVLLNLIFLKLNERLSPRIFSGLVFLWAAGISLSHLYRSLIRKFNWIKWNRIGLVFGVLFSVLLLGACLHGLQLAFEFLFFGFEGSPLHPVTFIANVLNLSFVFFIWSLIYFMIHYFENLRVAEIQNLKCEVSRAEIELQKLKSQLNPHFMFNAMNSIRALVDENPVRAKESITQLSNILRSTLQMGKKKLIPFREEMQMVEDYISLEKTRFEERLQPEIQIHPESYDFLVPPLMVQTLVENSIKHGISKIKAGGVLRIQSMLLGSNNLKIEISNPGVLHDAVPDSGFGIAGTRERLELIFGKAAEFRLSEESGGIVKSTLIIPKLSKS